MTEAASLASDLELVRAAVVQAGHIARKGFDSADQKVWDKSENHPVTQTDLAVNDYLEAALKPARPDYGWLSEETKDDHSRQNRTRSFVVDPIDGTRAFINKQPHFVISVGIIDNGKPVVAVLYNPITGELFEAVQGGGAKLGGKAVQATNPKQIAGCTMIGYPRKFRRLGWPDMQVRVVNSMAYRIALVASGQADATVAFTPKSDWDLAAAELIAREAGAVITDLRGHNFHYDRSSTSEFGVICAGPALYALLLKAVAPTLKDYDSGDLPPQALKDLGTRMTDRPDPNIQLLHLVFGGELVDINRTEFKDLGEVDFVGAYANYADAYAAWKSSAQRTVDNAHMRYFILHAHELIDPNKDGIIG